MRAISAGVGRGAGAVLALAAGVDLLCVGNPAFPDPYDDAAAVEEVGRPPSSARSPTAAAGGPARGGVGAGRGAVRARRSPPSGRRPIRTSAPPWRPARAAGVAATSGLAGQAVVLVPRASGVLRRRPGADSALAEPAPAAPARLAGARRARPGRGPRRLDAQGARSCVVVEGRPDPSHDAVVAAVLDGDPRGRRRVRRPARAARRRRTHRAHPRHRRRDRGSHRRPVAGGAPMTRRSAWTSARPAAGARGRRRRAGPVVEAPGAPGLADPGGVEHARSRPSAPCWSRATAGTGAAAVVIGAAGAEAGAGRAHALGRRPRRPWCPVPRVGVASDSVTAHVGALGGAPGHRARGRHRLGRRSGSPATAGAPRSTAGARGSATTAAARGSAGPRCAPCSRARDGRGRRRRR